MPDDFADALPPISTEDPCGPDLDLAGDPDFLNFVAAIEGQLPAEYFRDYLNPTRQPIDFATAFQTTEALLKRSLDVRLLTLAAKLAILNRDIDGFALWLRRLAALLADHWDDAHPRAEEGDYGLRLTQLSTLDDRAVVVLPMQFATLVQTAREGALAFRAQLVASEAIKPRENEKIVDARAIERMMGAVELSALDARLATLRSIRAALEALHAETLTKVGAENAVEFPNLSPLVGEMIAFVEAALVKRDPTRAASVPAGEATEPAPEGGEAAPAAGGALAGLADVEAALGAALAYYVAHEPSSPALLLVGQARASLGKNLYDVMKLIAPAHADAARLFVGPDSAFTVPVSALSGGPGQEVAAAEVAPAASRAEALALIDRVAAHMRRVEPSSPVPYLIDKARALAARDFVSLLAELLPDEDIAAMKTGH